jgi:multicomponent Na+:H+ antiporter subunit G
MDKIIISVLILLGSFFILIASIGMIRFKDLYGRLHASTKATSFGILLLLIGVSLYFNDFQVYVKTLLIILFVYLTAPLAAHSISKSYKPKEGKVEDEKGKEMEKEK